MACCTWRSLKETVARKRLFEPGQLESGNLRRCLNRWDLTGLGLGSTLGVGVYVLIGYVALHIAGPSIVLSFLIAAVASMFAGLCYAEFGSRVPRAGSAYIYTYVTIGEMAAFIVGWSNILESLFGAASVAKGLSLYMDMMVNNTMSNWYTSVAPVASPHLSPYFDILAFLIVITIGIMLAVGVRESAMVNNVLAILNMAVILFIVVAGGVAANPSNWYIPAAEVPLNHGSGGFFPYGVLGTLKGAAVCFYGFIGFETINASSEEARDPRRSVPATIVTVLAIVFIAYTSVAIVITMMVPYYLQDSVTAVAMAFSHVGWDWAKWIVSIGAFFGIFAGLIGAMFPLTRLIYAMSSDGLLLRWFSKVTSKRKSPVFATALSTAITAVLAGIVELDQLVMMMCIGTLLSYTFVAICVILLRYQSDYTPEGSSGYMRRLIGCGEKFPTLASARIIDVSLILFICLCVVTALVAIHVETPMIPMAVLNALAIIIIVVMAVQPKTKEELTFKTPLVPLIPCLSIYVNIHLMVLINVQTWIRVVIWILIGIPIYILCACCYKRTKNNLQENIAIAFEEKNGKPPVQIIVESPTPPDTITRFSNYGGEFNAQAEKIETEEVIQKDTRKEIYKTDEIVLHQAYIENNEEKEAKIIDLLDQVLQAEEDSYGEVVSLKEQKEDEVSNVQENVPHRKSLSELSDAGSDASLGNQVLSKYDVIAQVHREDLPRVNEEEERIERDVEAENIDEIDEQEEVTAFNDSETNSRTDESGYSDTIDRNALSESLDDPKEDAPYIPVPPPMDENYFKSTDIKKFYSLSSRHTKVNPKENNEEEEKKPRESIRSNNSQSDDNMIFGSDRQIHFMSKLNNIFQNKMAPTDEEEPRRRSHSTGNVVENTDFSITRERPPIFMDLKKELMSGEAAQNLRPVNVEESDEKETDGLNEVEDVELSREHLKSKLETIFASGGPQMLKPRLLKSNPPTPEDSYQTDTSSTESIPKLPKMEKNDTLKRQKAKFSEVLNSFRLSLNKDDEV